MHRVGSGKASGVKLVPKPNMRIKPNNQIILDRSRPGLTTTAIGTEDPQGTNGNWATLGQRKRRKVCSKAEREEERQNSETESRDFEYWDYVLERRGMKVSHSKTEYMCE